MAASTLGYSLQATINLPGSVGGHGDWVTYDASTGYVWLAQSPDNNVVVINTANNSIVATVPNIGNGNGVAVTPNTVFVADVTNNTVDAINKSTYAVTAIALPAGFTTPDSVTYIPSLNEVAVASDDANQEVFINASTFAVSAPLQLTPSPAVAGPDVSTFVPQTGYLYQPVDNVVDVINPATQQIVTTWTLLASAATGSVKPGVYDPVTNTFLFGTTTKAMLAVNASTGAVLSSIAIPGSVDESAIDVNARLAYVGDKSGVVDIINLDNDTLAGQLPATVNAHTLTVDPANASVYIYQYNNTVSAYGATPITTDTIYRFFEKTDGSHFFTTSAAEANQLAATRPDLVAETNGFGAVDPSSNDPNAAAVFRFFETTNGTHFYTTSATEKASIQASRPDLVFEGTAFSEDSTQLAGDRAVYRFFDVQNGTHFFSADPNEVASLNQNTTFKAEGIAFYAPSTLNIT